MNRYAWLLLAAIVAAGATGYWLGQNRVGELMPSPGPADTPAPSGPVLYYRDPDGKPFYSLLPKDAPNGRPYHPVLASEEPALAATPEKK